MKNYGLLDKITIAFGLITIFVTVVLLVVAIVDNWEILAIMLGVWIVIRSVAEAVKFIAEVLNRPLP